MAEQMEDDLKSLCLVAVNLSGQFGLWPSSDKLPGGWDRVFGPSSRRACLEEVDRLSSGAGRKYGGGLDQLGHAGPALLSGGPLRTMPEVLRQRAAEHPDQIAIEAEGRRMTYGELDARAQHLARELRSRGVGERHIVALLLGRSADFVVALFAIWYAGATAAPLDPSLPEDRLHGLLDDCSASLIIADSVITNYGTVPVLGIDHGTSPHCRIHDEQRAALEDVLGVLPGLCIYTSGSTGRPKGVLVSQRSLAHYAVTSAARLGMQSSDRVLQISSPGFDMAMHALCGAIAAGASIVIYPCSQDVSTHSLDAFVKRSSISVACLPTALWRIWVGEHAWAGHPLPTCLRLVVTGGEKIEKADFASWRSLGAASGPLLCNAYGPTEATISATMWLYAPGQQFDGDRDIPIGTPNCGYECHVVDHRLRPLSTGEVGQIAICGAGVGIGYLRRPSQTAAAFVPDPFTSRGGQRMYLTGDRGRVGDAGELEFLGRADTQVKIQGYRVEPEEVESVLLDHPDVANAAVIVRDYDGGKHLVAFYQARPNTVVGDTHLRVWLARRLPAYMVPTRVASMEHLPMTGSAKIDRQALAALDAEAGGQLQEHTAVEALESRLSAVWKLTLGVPKVSPHDNFFEAGGHSLLVTRLIWAVKRSLNLELTYQQVFSNPTYAGILSVLASSGGTKINGDRSEPRGDIEADRSIPVTFQQRRLLKQADADFATAIRIVPIMLEMSGELDVDRLRAAVHTTLSRHAVFRLRFTATSSGFEQRLSGEPARVHIERRTIPHDCNDARSAALDIAVPWVFRGLDIAQSQFARILVITSDTGKSWLVLGLHHIIVDARSAHILISEILGAYGQRSHSGIAESLYLQYAIDQVQRVESGAYASDLKFWSNYLRDAVPLVLPRVSEEAAAASGGPRAYSEVIDVAGLYRLRTRATAERSTSFVLCLTALSILLSNVALQSDILLGIPHHNRPSSEYDDCVGYFVNGLPLRVHVRGDQSVGSILSGIHRHLENGPKHLGVSMSDVELPTKHGCSAPFQVMVVNEQAASYTPIHGLTVEEVRFMAPFTKSDLTVGVSERPDGMRLSFIFDPTLLPDSQVSQWLEDFVSIIHKLTTHSGNLESLSVGDLKLPERVLDGHVC